MSHYRYRAVRANGALATGLMSATDEAQATMDLVARGLHPIRLEPESLHAGRVKGAGRRDLAILFESLASLVAAGLPLERAVAASQEVAGSTLGERLEQVRKELHEGLTLADALERARAGIPEVVIGMIRAGERGSELSSALRQVATQLEAEADLAARVRTALAYPAILMAAGLTSVTVITTVVLPRFVVLLGELGHDLPPATRVLLAISGLVSRLGVWLGVAAIAVPALLVAWTQQPSGRAWLHRSLIRLPVVGRLRLALATARVGRSLGAMLGSGMPLLAALSAAGEAAGDTEVQGRLKAAQERVAGGEPLAASLTRESALTWSALQLIAVGENSGQLSLMAMKAGDLAAQEADRGLRALVIMLEPALVIAFGGLVAFVAAALLQAVYGLRPM